MMLLLKKNLSPSFFPRFTPYKPIYHLLLFSSSSSSSADQNPPPKPNFITDYLITSCGFAPERAATASKPISHLTSPNKPDSVLQFFRQHGFCNTHIRSIISGYPRILCTDVDSTLGPNLTVLRQLGFSNSELEELITSNPRLLVLRSAIPRLNFWRALLNDNKKNLLLAFTRNRGIINHDIDKGVAPKIALLKDYGLSESDIGMIVVRGHRFITRSISSMEALLKRAQELGFPRESSMFGHGLSSLSSIGSDMFKAKMELLKSFGWSEGEVLAALQKAPFFIHLSAENIREKMEFLVEKAGCTQSYIASRPLLLGFSLEKRLVPRYHVMKILKSNELLRRDRDLNSIMGLSEKHFMGRIILRYKEQVPKLDETYIAACAGQIPLSLISEGKGGD